MAPSAGDSTTSSGGSLSRMTVTLTELSLPGTSTARTSMTFSPPATDQFSGAEIEQAVVAGLYRALERDMALSDALLLEGADSPYANIVTARPDNAESPAIAKLMKALRSPETKKFIEEKYKGAIIPAF